MKSMNVKKLVLSALFLAIGILLPFITMQIPKIGNMLLPMHIPVILCGFFCGAPYGLLIGFITPILRSIVCGMPIMMPVAVAMAFELATYGVLTGFLYRILFHKKFKIYVSLITAMIVGRFMWGITSYFLYLILGNTFTWKIFVTQAFVTAIPGIIIQLIVIPFVVYQLQSSLQWQICERKVVHE